MADYFDSIRGTTPALLSEEERKRLGLLSQVMEALPVRAGSNDPIQQAMLSQAGFIQQPKQPGQDGLPGYITPERLVAQQQAAVMEDQIAEIQKRYDDQRTSAMFRLGDGLADAGRLFLSPLLFLAGEDFNDYDPSAKLRAGYRRELQGLVQTQNDSLTNLISARTEREKTLREIQEEARQAGLPISSEMKAVRDYAMLNDRMAEYNSGNPALMAQLTDDMLIAQGKKFRVGQTVINEKQYDTLNSANDKFSKAVVGYREAYEGYDRLMRALDVTSGVSDIAVIFSFMKSLDPRSVVREGEFQVAANAGGLWDRITNLEKALEGRLLTDNVRKQISEAATALMQSYTQSYSDIRASAIGRTSFLTGVPEAEVERTLNRPITLYGQTPPPSPPPPPAVITGDDELDALMNDDED